MLPPSMITKYLRLLLRISVIYGDNRPRPSSTVHNYASLLFLMLGTCCSLFPTLSSPRQIMQTLLKSSDEKPNVYFASLIVFKDICRESEISSLMYARKVSDSCILFIQVCYRAKQIFAICATTVGYPEPLMPLMPVAIKILRIYREWQVFANSESTTNSFSKWNDTSNTSIFRFYIDESRNELS